MSKIKGNPLLVGAAGMFGKTIIFREVRGTLVMSSRPRKRATLTPHQEIMRSRFLAAIKYAHNAMADPTTKAAYSAAITKNKFTAFHVAQTDALTAPVIHALDTSQYRGNKGDALWINATDDFKVASIQVNISNNGMMLEQGEAQLLVDSLDEWRYLITVANENLDGTKITVTVKDRPGNVTTMERSL